MGAKTKISWCHHTFNPWWGCARVSPGCEHCYAETFDKRVGRADWGVQAPRRLFGDAHWNEPLKWDREAAAAGQRHRVFCASMADVFEDRRDLDRQRYRLWELINVTRNLDWLLLTKRPQNVEGLAPSDWVNHGFPGNVWLGTTVEDNRRAAERLSHLRRVYVHIRFLSMEPLLEEVLPDLAGISWVIAGAESGHGARPMDEDWVRRLRDHVIASGAAFLYKQKVIGRLKIELPMLDGRKWEQYPTPVAP